MAVFHRRDAPPADMLARLAKSERVLSWADAVDGTAVVATPRGLWWPGAAGPRRIGWEHIDKVVWRDATLTAIEADVIDDLLLVDRPAVSVELATPRDLPAAVRKRVEANIVRSELRAFGAGAARFVGRRIPGHDGVVWWARLEGDVPDSADVRSRVRAQCALFGNEWAEP